MRAGFSWPHTKGQRFLINFFAQLWRGKTIPTIRYHRYSSTKNTKSCVVQVEVEEEETFKKKLLWFRSCFPLGKINLEAN